MKKAIIEEQEKRSEEVQDIIERMPTRWTYYVALLVTTLMGVVILLGFLIKYPDTVDGQISITGTHAPVRLVANASGRIHLLKKDGCTLKNQEVIGYIENGADYNDIDKVVNILNKGITPTVVFNLPKKLMIGEVSSSYNAFVISYELFDRLRNSQLYETMRKTLKGQISADKDVVENLEKEMLLKKQITSNIHDTYSKDSTLLGLGGISQTDFYNKENNYLSQEESNVNLKSTQLIKLSEINKNFTELTRLSIEESESLQKAYIDMQAKFGELSNVLNTWKERYLLTSPINGKMEYLGFWRENSYIDSNTELFTILPAENDIVGEVYIPSIGAGKVEAGMQANVKLNDFPYDEYGLLKGKVHSISSLTNKISQKDGTIETYLVIVHFPNGTNTNFGKHLSLNFETKGTIEIITKRKRLIERLFDNLKAKGEK